MDVIFDQRITNQASEKHCIVLHINWKIWLMLSRNYVFTMDVIFDPLIINRVSEKHCIVLHINWKIWSM